MLPFLHGPFWGVAPCIPRFWGLVRFTSVHPGMEHLFPECFGVDPPLSAFPFIYTQPSLKRRLPSAYTSILSILTNSDLEFMACGDPHSRIGAIYCGSRVIPFWGSVRKTFQEQLDGTVPGGCAIYLVVKKSCPRKAFVEHTHPLLLQRFDDRNVQSRKKGFKLKMG